MKAIGLMSGTSADALDIALIEISNTDVKLLEFREVNYPGELHKKILRTIHSTTISLEEIADLNIELGKFYGESVKAFIENIRLRKDEIGVIGSHGQTIFHRSKRYTGKGATLQIGDGAHIAKITGIPVVSDFRMDDLAVGGEGAPLTPYFHHFLFKNREKPLMVLNIGGIANITVVTGKIDDLIAFDTGPGNSLIDIAVCDLTGGESSFDKDGTFSGKGNIIEEMLEELCNHPFFRIPPPKSTGREDFGMETYLNVKKRYGNNPPEDIVRTFVELTACSIHDAYRRFILPHYPARELIVTGGGSRNPTLTEALRKYFAEIPVKKIEDYGYRSEAMEAMAFALFGYKTLFEKEGINIPGATGAERRVICGKISLP